MEVRPADTDPETYQVWLRVLRGLTPDQRLRNTLKLCLQSRQLAANGISQRHPNYTEHEVEMALRRWHWGDDLFCQVYPDAELLAP